MMRGMLIGVAGHARHGKDSIAKVLKSEYGFVQVNFADALRELAAWLNPVLDIDPNDGTETMNYQEYLDFYGYEEAKTWVEFRDFLKDLGEGVRNIVDENAWVNAAVRKVVSSLERGDHVVMTDVRYPNEVRAVERMGGEVWKVIRPNFNNGVDPTHPSESHIPHISADRIFNNDATLWHLETQVRATIERMGVNPHWVSLD